MKKNKLLLGLLLLLFLGVGCDRTPGDATKTGGSVGSGESSVMMEQPFNLFCGSMAETPEGYYYLRDTFVYYCPRGESRFVPLCGKPNCTHNDPNCNAFVSLGSPLELYDGMLYIDVGPDEDALSFVKMKLDGTEHETVSTDLKAYGLNGSDYSFSSYLPHGKAYVTVKEDEPLLSDQKGDRLIVVDMKDGSSREIAADYFREHRMYGIEAIHNGSIFGDASTIQDRFDSSKWKTIELESDSGKITELSLSHWGYRDLTDSTIYYFDWDSLEGYKAERPGFKEYDRATGRIQEFGMPVEEKNIGLLFYTADHIYLCALGDGEEDTLYILSREYQVLDQISLRKTQQIISVTSDCIYLTDPDARSDVQWGETSILRLDKTQIGSHQMTPVKVEIKIPEKEWNPFPEEEE